MEQREHDPYVALVEVGVLQGRLAALRDRMTALDLKIGELIEEWAGRPFADGSVPDRFWDEWCADVDRRLQAEGGVADVR